MIKRILAPLVAASALVSAAPAMAVSYAAVVELSTTSPCPSFCGPNPTTLRENDGGEFALNANTTISNGFGSGAGFAMLDGSSLLPVLGAEAFSNANTRSRAVATGVQSYMYTGATTTSISLTYTFEGVLDYAVGSNQDAEIGSRIGIVRGGIPDGDFITDFPTLFFEILDSNPNVSVIQLDNFGLTQNTADPGPISFTSSIFFDLNPGDVISVAAQLVAQAERGGSADALSTLTMEFSDDSNLVAIGVVPVPAAVWLFGSALLGLFGLRRRG